jgi:hypothetical protein
MKKRRKAGKDKPAERQEADAQSELLGDKRQVLMLHSFGV